VNHPDLISELDSINNAKGIASVRERDFHHTRTEAVWFGAKRTNGCRDP
jgi:hypothetical protein